ncbi:MAG: LysR family transcriptional regulator [Planctomycetota bacterium]|nr:LysR family transcriptional regulator [Planctomycetota bacterium]
MSWVNYTHLKCFWATVREGGVSAASRALFVSQPTVSAHLKSLETAVGEPLLSRSRRGVELTPMGRTVYRYADEIFRLSTELEGTVRGQGTARVKPLRLGIADVMPKTVVHHIIQPAFETDPPAHVVCYEGKPPDLLTRLAREEIDAVLTDTPVDATYHVNAFNHLLGESAITVFAPEGDAARYRRKFPESLDGAPWLLPTRDTALRRELDRWFGRMQLHPDIQAEFEDLALLKAFARDGLGLFALPSVVESDVRRQCNARVVGRIDEVRERFYVITLERRVRHGAVSEIVAGARKELFA